MSNKEKVFYNFERISEWLGLDFKFDEGKDYPFNRKREDVEFSWGYILIPKQGIKETVQNRLNTKENVSYTELKELKMMYIIPFTCEGKPGALNVNLSLSYEYCKQHKYGDITNNIYETCFHILEISQKTNDFYIIDDPLSFITDWVIDNQWGLGCINTCAGPSEVLKAKNSNFTITKTDYNPFSECEGESKVTINEILEEGIRQNKIEVAKSLDHKVDIENIDDDFSGPIVQANKFESEILEK